MLGHLRSGAGSSKARAVNDSGWVVGNSRVSNVNSHAFLYKSDSNDEVMIDLDTLGSTSSDAYAINNKGVIVGYSDDENQQRRAARVDLVDDVWQWTQLEGLAGETASYAFGINEFDEIVGRAELAGEHAAIRYVDNRADDLNNYLPVGSPWQLSLASGINDNGEIVGIGKLGEDVHSFLMTPLNKLPLYADPVFFKIKENDSPTGIGSVVAMDEFNLVIGAPNDAKLGKDAGAVFIYSREDIDDVWGFVTKLTAQDGVAGDNFGKVVAIGKDRLAIASKSGVYVYKGGRGSWRPHGQKVTFTYISSGIFDLAIDGDLLAVASAYDLWSFRYEDGNWGYQSRVSSANDFRSLVLRNNTLFAGLPYYGDVGIYTYDSDADKWNEFQTIDKEGYFGESLALYEDLLVVGAPRVGSSNAAQVYEPGAVYVYRKREDGKWDQYDKLESSGVSDYISQRYGSSSYRNYGEWFGASVAIHGEYIAIGAPRSNEGADWAGSVYVFQRHGNRWIEEIKLTSDDPVVNQGLGASVALYGSHVVGGAPRRNDGKVFSRPLISH